MSERTDQFSTVPANTQALDSKPVTEAAADSQNTLAFVSAENATLPTNVPGYQILDTLGRGGMGIVYKAMQARLNRLVALKMILIGPLADGPLLRRFRAEAEAVARLQHPNIVQVHEVGDHKGLPFISLEFVEGGSLAQKLSGTPLPAKEAARLVEVLARAMAYAHEHQIIHRDLKPANVLLTKDGTPKIADFGLAKQLESASSYTQTGAIVGTPSYMAPEQAGGQGQEVAPSVDVYALGAILYECLTGRPPFRTQTPMATLLLLATEEPVPPTRLQPETPRDLETICLKCLEKLPPKRYHNALELAEDLRRYQAGEPITARPVGVLEQGVKWAKRRPTVAGLLATIVGLTAAALLILAIAWQHAQAGWGLAATALGQVQDEKQRVGEALQREEKLRLDAEAARKAEAEQRRRFQRQTAELVLDRGLSLSEQGDARGLLWLARGVQSVSKDDPDLDRALRLNLAAWSKEAHPLRFVLPGKRFIGMAYSPDGKTLLTWGYDGAERWDAATGTFLYRLTNKGYVSSAAYSSDGSTIATASHDGLARFWDAQTGQPRGEPQASLMLAANIVGMLAYS